MTRIFSIQWPRASKGEAPGSPPEADSHSADDYNVDAVRWRAFLEATDDAVFLADSAGTIILVNHAAIRLFPHPPPIPEQGAAVSADPNNSILAFTVSSELNDLYRLCVARRSLIEEDIQLSHPNARSLHVRVMPISQNEFLLVLRDQTELRRLERVRRDFVANVSHELRTPLTSIKAMAETLLDGARLDESVAPKFLQTIMNESDRLVRISSDLLDLSKLEAKGVQKHPVNMSVLVTEIMGRLHAQAKKAGITLTGSIRPGLIVPCDHDEMAQVLVNLLDNAISYTPSGGLVTISATETSETVTVSVRDTGIGILSHDMPRLFERFYRADKARSRASGGTGLGLSIVKHIVENHGGSVGVESEYNKGSVFTFTLPVDA